VAVAYVEGHQCGAEAAVAKPAICNLLNPRHLHPPTGQLPSTTDQTKRRLAWSCFASSGRTSDTASPDSSAPTGGRSRWGSHRPRATGWPRYAAADTDDAPEYPIASEAGTRSAW